MATINIKNESLYTKNISSVRLIECYLPKTQFDTYQPLKHRVIINMVDGRSIVYQESALLDETNIVSELALLQVVKDTLSSQLSGNILINL